MFRDFGNELIDLLAGQMMIPVKNFWQIALDGSGPLTENDIHYAYAGVMGSINSWRLYRDRLETLLNRFDLPYVRMVDAMNFRGPFAAKSAEWGAERYTKREEFLREMVRLVPALDLRPIGFAAQVGGLKEKQAALRKREVFQRVIQGVASDHRDRYFALICDTEHDAADHYRRWLANLQQRDENSRRIHTLCFCDDKIMAPIQMADIAAYLLREDAERDCFRPNDTRNPLLLEMWGNESLKTGFGRMLNGEDV